MDAGAVIAARLATQRLTGPPAGSPLQVVRELLAVQAQDAPLARAMVALRCAGTASDVAAAVASGEIVRTHVLRPTWHYVAAVDLRPLLALTSPKVESGMASRHRQLELAGRPLDAALETVLARLDADRSRLQLREAEADLQRRRNDVERGEQLLARKLIPATQHDQAVSDYAMRRADVGLARVNVGKAEIRAPFDGTVTRRWVKRGQLLAHNAPVFDVADFTDLRADLRVPERDASALAANQPVRFTADALGTREFAARIERVAPVVDRSSGTVGVTVRIDNRDLALRPGQFARMDIAFRHFDDTVLMPKAAVLGSRNAAVAYVIRDGKAVRTPIRLGYENGARVQVLEGVEAGSEVVVSGHAALSDGTAVHVLPAIDTTAAVRNLAALGGKRS